MAWQLRMSLKVVVEHGELSFIPREKSPRARYDDQDLRFEVLRKELTA